MFKFAKTIAPFRSSIIEATSFRFYAATRAAPEKKQLVVLKTKLQSEKKTLRKLNTQIATLTKKHKQLEKDRKAKGKAKEKALETKALKKFSGLSAFNIYVKENATKENSLLACATQWDSLSADAKQEYQEKADEQNSHLISTVYFPKPVRPPHAFAAYVKKHYFNDGRPVYEAMKELSSEWKELSESEKRSYYLPESELAAHQKAYAKWKVDRIQAYKKHLAQ